MSYGIGIQMASGSSRGREWEALRKRVLDRDGWTCSYCGKPLEGADAQADHITPKAEGGQDTLLNLTASCASCNNAKGAKVLIRTNYYNPRWLDRL